MVAIEYEASRIMPYTLEAVIRPTKLFYAGQKMSTYHNIRKEWGYPMITNKIGKAMESNETMFREDGGKNWPSRRVNSLEGKHVLCLQIYSFFRLFSKNFLYRECCAAY